MTTVGNGAQGSAITAHNSALVGGTSYFGQGLPSGGTAIVDEPMRRVLTLLAQIAQTNVENERQLLFERLYEMQGEDDVLVEQIGLNVAQLPEGISMVEASIREAMALLVRVSGTDNEDEQQSLLGRLIILQRQNNELVARMGVKVEKLPDGEFDVIPGSTDGGNIERQNNKDGFSLDDADTISSIVLNGLQIGDLLSEGKLIPYLAKYAKNPWVIIGLLTAAVLYDVAKHPDRYFEILPDARQQALEKINEGLGTKDDYIIAFRDTADARKKYLINLKHKDPDLFEQEMAIADMTFSFSEADEIARQKGLPVPQPTPFELPKMVQTFGYLTQSSVVFPDTQSVLDGDGHAKQSPFSAFETLPESKKNQLPGLYISNGSAEDVAKQKNNHENVPNAPTIKRKPFVESGEGLAEPSLSQKIANPLTGAEEGTLDALPAGNSSPYQMDGVGADSNGTLDAQGVFSDRLSAALEKLAEVCALPRVSVGTLAETAVVREEADLDTLARRFADDLLHAQLVS